MKTEIRFLLAIFLMLLVLVGTNILFPPVVPEPGIVPDSIGLVDGSRGAGSATPGAEGRDVSVPRVPVVDPAAEDAGGVADAGAADAGDPALPGTERAGEAPAAAPPARTVSVESPLYAFEFSTVGARLLSAEMSQFRALNREGLVDLVPEGADGYLGNKLVVGRDTVDLSRAPFRASEERVVLTEGGGPRAVTFTYEHPSSRFRFDIEYEFAPDRYTVVARARAEGLDRPLLVTDMGSGLAFAEVDSVSEARMMAYVLNHAQNGIRSVLVQKAEPRIEEGPLQWAAFRSKFFVLALMAGETEDVTNARYLGGLIVRESELPERVDVAAAQVAGPDGTWAYRLFLGPQEYTRLTSLGQAMEEVNPYGWRFFRPIIRPFVSIIMAVLVFLHTNLSMGYGWVLIVFGVMMRVVLFPLNHKAMKAQLRNMAVQPLLQEIQTKYKDNPEKLQKEMMRLYKEHGFNPLAGCLPMLLPWPVLIALFFVFQNTIELRGVPFLWMPDLSAPDPLYILPAFLGVSMFLMQWVSLKSLDQPNPQMKMMMWILPIMMVFIFLNLASGLNLYYATANIATIPQQVWIANERKRMKGMPPPKRT